MMRGIAPTISSIGRHNATLRSNRERRERSG
jgi:hypothetical protein